jgi:hypothetical protein
MAVKLMKLTEAAKKHNVSYSTANAAVRKGTLEAVKEDGQTYVDEEEFVKWAATIEKRRQRKPRKKKATPHRSNTAVFLALLMKIYGELTRMGTMLDGQPLIKAQQIREEIMKTVRGGDYD